MKTVCFFVLTDINGSVLEKTPSFFSFSIGVHLQNLLFSNLYESPKVKYHGDYILVRGF